MPASVSHCASRISQTRNWTPNVVGIIITHDKDK